MNTKQNSIQNGNENNSTEASSIQNPAFVWPNQQPATLQPATASPLPMSPDARPEGPRHSSPILHPASSSQNPASSLLDDLCALLSRFVVLPQFALETLSLWILHTYAFHLREVSTYIGVESPEKRCGKTTLIEVISQLVNRPVIAANISPPAFFRVIEELQPTLLIDEADTFLQGNDELRGILNSGYNRKTAFVVRVANQSPASLVSSKYSEGGFFAPGIQQPESDSRLAKPATCNFQLATSPATNPPIHQSTNPSLDTRPSSPSTLSTFSTWCPKMIAAIGRLPDTLADRCIVVRMQRKRPEEQCERLRNLDAEALRRRCASFVHDHAAAIAAARPQIPDLNDRAADIWEPLLALADLAGGRWPQLARQAALGLTTRANEHNPIGSLLLDMFVIFVEQEADRLFSRSIVERLNRFPGRPWTDLFKGKPLTETTLSQHLRPYGIRPRNIWIQGAQAKGYVLDDCRDTFRRYIPKSEIESLKAENAPCPADQTALASPSTPRRKSAEMTVPGTIESVDSTSLKARADGAAARVLALVRKLPGR